MTKSKLSKTDQSLVKAAQQGLRFLKDDASAARVRQIDIVNVKSIRARLSLSQEQFAEAYGIPLRTVQSWEQGVRQPDATARAYLKTIGKIPAQVRSALGR
jgi:putative transcriptional regulator